MKYVVKVIDSQCIGAASCVAIAPNTFQLNDANISTVVNPTGDSDDTIMSAAKACPVNAIEIYEVDDAGNEGKKVWPPLG